MTTTTSEPLAPVYGQETSERNWLQSKVLAHLPLATVLLIGIMLLAAVLNFANINTIGDANVYYTAAVKSMLQSFSNFFFVAAEPGGSVSVDKPPLGLWLQAISALIFGVNGFAVTLPQILAGIFSIPVLYVLVKRYFGSAAGLIAAFVLAVTPVAIAAQRNNTMDATLIFTLLLAAWAFIKGTESGRLRWLLLGGVLVGLGFNIKMLQALLPLPAFYALYFLGAKVGWWRKIGHLIATTIVLLAVSLSWVAIVDLTPASQRPYVGSSSTNSALELAIGYNGLERLFGGVIGGGGGAALPSTGDGGFGTPPNTAPDATNGFAPPADDGSTTDGTDGTDGRGGFRPDDGGMGAPGGGIGAGEIGQASITRLFTTPLANEISWLLPFGLFSVGLLVVASRVRLPLSDAHKGAVLFGGWLLTEVVFFSAASFFHAYYLAMLAPPLAALVGIGVLRLWKLRDQHHLLASLLLIAAGAGTLLFQVSVASQYTSLSSLWWIVPAVVMLVIGALLLLQRINASPKLLIAGFVCIVFAMTLVPTVWAGLTTLDTGNNTTLPHAYSGTNSGGGFTGAGRDDGGMAGGFGNDRSVNSELLTYLQENTQDTRYLVAVQSSMQGDPYILATGRPVLLMGGFSGSDPVVDATDLQRLVDNGELRYILYGGRGGPGGNTSSTISTWLQSSCTVVTDVSSSGGTLYQCLPTTS
ncbi:MAG: glycosyltransferase family 39 protein [Anaerolineae bacterium]